MVLCVRWWHFIVVLALCAAAGGCRSTVPLADDGQPMYSPRMATYGTGGI